jgi:hypothetical protein
MERREFIKKAGLGSAVLASAPVMVEALAEPAWADVEGGTRFRCVVVSHSTTSSDLVAFNGNGAFDASSVGGRGAFVHWSPVGSPPFPIVATGRWRAKEFVSFESFGMYGALEAGILEMMITLLPAGSSKISAMCKVVCNIGPGALSTGEEEGVTLELPGLEFEPLSPAVGLTIFVP